MIRIARVNDAQSLLDIYSYYVEKTAITFEYDVPTVEEFRKRIKNITERYPYFVYEENGRIIGYAYANTFKDRAAYDRAVEVTIYVDKNSRHNGIGKKLYKVLENALKQQNITNLYACIGYPEVEDEYLTKNSVGYHEHLGYRFVGEFRKCGYKFNRWYNMVWMEKVIGEHFENAKPVLKFDDVKNKLGLEDK